MTATVLPRGFDRLSHALDTAPRRAVAAAAALIAVGALVTFAPDPGGVVVGGTGGWVLWLAGMTILAVCLMLMLIGRPVSALMIAGGIAAVSGAFLFYNPNAGAVAVAILAISALVTDGGFQLALALKLRPASLWRWLVASAIASVLAALLLSSGALFGPASGAGPFVGLALVSSGLGLLLFRQSTTRRADRP